MIILIWDYYQVRFELLYEAKRDSCEMKALYHCALILQSPYKRQRVIYIQVGMTEKGEKTEIRRIWYEIY